MQNNQTKSPFIITITQMSRVVNVSFVLFLYFVSDDIQPVLRKSMETPGFSDLHELKSEQERERNKKETIIMLQVDFRASERTSPVLSEPMFYDLVKFVFIVLFMSRNRMVN